MVKQELSGKKTIGILGGMGPEATVNLFNLIVSLTKAEKDNEHIPIIIINNPKIPDRTDAIINDRESPLPSLIKAAQKLEKVGADFIVMPCITAHYYYHLLYHRTNHHQDYKHQQNQYYQHPKKKHHHYNNHP